MNTYEKLFGRIINSKGPIINKYSILDTEKTSIEKDIVELINNINKSNNNILFIRNGSGNSKDLHYFSKNLDKLKKKIFLLTMDGDRNVPSTINDDTVYFILSNDNIMKWFTQNYDMSLIHPKLKHIPIGFDLHTKRWLVNNNYNDKINYMIECRLRNIETKKISNQIFSDTHFSPSHRDRIRLFKTLKNNKSIYFLKKRNDFKEITEMYNKYQFVLSPRGNGVDCHRTWELFLAGAIIITETSSLDSMYENNNLPVVILKNYNELNTINLDKKLEQFLTDNIEKTKLYNILPRLSFNYWLNT
jgi:hypothetical protein